MNKNNLTTHITGECQVQSSDNLTAVSNDDGVFAYFTKESTATAFVNVIKNTTRRLELLAHDVIDEEVFMNELEHIIKELKDLNNK